MQDKEGPLGDLSTQREAAEAGAGPAVSEQPCEGSFELGLHTESATDLNQAFLQEAFKWQLGHTRKCI